MRFPILAEDRAREMLDRIDPARNEAVNITPLQSHAGAGASLDEALIVSIVSKLEALRLEFAEDQRQFDAEASTVLHKLLPSDPELTSNDGFWRWMALGPLCPLSMWRFPPRATREERKEGESKPEKRFNRQNFGVGATARQRAECYPYKLWLRGELGHTPEDEDPYRFARRGDVDFWTSHIHRQTYTTNRRLCSALARFQYPDGLDGNPRLHPGVEDPTKNRLGVRSLAKRLRRIQASYELSLLDDDQLDALVLEQSQGLSEAKR